MKLWRMSLLIAVVAILPTVSDCAAAPRPANDAALKTQVARLLTALDAPTRKERVAAERDLTSLGPDVLPLLPPPELLRRVGVREAVRRVRVSLERTKAIESMRPSHITLKGDFTLAKILTDFGAQSGNQIDFSALPKEIQSQQHTIDYDKRAFWPALDQLIARAGLEYGDDADAGRLLLKTSQKGKAPDASVTYSGPFRITVTGARLRPFPNRGPFRIVRVNYRVRAEPRLRPLFVKYRGRDFAAKSSAGLMLSPFSPDAQPEIPLGEGGRHLNLQSDFRVPSDNIPTTLSFRGKLTLTAAAGAERIEFTRLKKADGTARRRGGVTVKLQKVEFGKATPDGRTARFRVVVSYDIGGPAFESHRTWVFHNRVYLQASDGRRIERDGVFHTNLQTDGAVVVEYGFRNLKADAGEYRFVYVAPTLLVKLPIEFDFAKIPLSFSDKIAPAEQLRRSP
ncbi:MAG: hypothetical protein HOL01_26815 [Planctomycetaceae bacterium]|nr:hypothetical protein [Planctomycetaceae bacterium]MBT6484479.1 hypothetical protein [Planctomycetaceae bacterium]MBT6498143.1 hypothetical protein [Planctomycetaceae bacterium]